MAGARKCPSCGRWVAAGKSFCNDSCAARGCPHRLRVWTWLGDLLKPWTLVYAPLDLPCEINHRKQRYNAGHFHRQAGAWT